MTRLHRSFRLLAMAAGLACLPACETNSSSNQAGPPYLAGLRREGNELAKGRTETETTLAMKKDNVSYWDGDGVSGAPSIVISISQQRAYFYKGAKLVGVSQVSTGDHEVSGDPDRYTPTGNYKVIQKSPDHVSNVYGKYVYPDGTVARDAIHVNKVPQPPGTRFVGTDMPYFIRFHGGVGLHGGLLPGYAASGGCVRMPHNMAKIFYDNVSIGTPVQVVR